MQPTCQADHFLAMILDACSRKVFGWSFGREQNTKLMLAALQSAIAQRQPGPALILHSDQGSQYTAHAYRELLANHRNEASYLSVVCCYDNTMAESFFATLKREVKWSQQLPTATELRTHITDWIEGRCNTRRLHSNIGYRSPVGIV